jgi:hypothetical protein
MEQRGPAGRVHAAERAETDRARVGVYRRAAVVDGFEAQLVVAGLVAADLAQPDDR